MRTSLRAGLCFGAKCRKPRSARFSLLFPPRRSEEGSAERIIYAAIRRTRPDDRARQLQPSTTGDPPPPPSLPLGLCTQRWLHSLVRPGESALPDALVSQALAFALQTPSPSRFDAAINTEDRTGIDRSRGEEASRRNNGGWKKAKNRTREGRETTCCGKTSLCCKPGGTRHVRQPRRVGVY